MWIMASRYSFSSPGSRFGLQPWFRLGNLDVTTTVLVAGLAVLSIFAYAVDKVAMLNLALLPWEVRDGEVWRVVTWPFFNDPDIWTVITIAIFWYFGSEIEGRMGRNRYAVFLAVLTIVPGLAATLFDVVQLGIRPLEFGVFLVFILEFPYARFFFGIPAWVIGAVFIGLEVLQLMADDNSDGIIVLFVSLATAAIIARSYGMAQSVSWIPALPIPGARGGSSRRRKPARRRAKPSGSSRVVEGPWDSSTRTGPLPQPPRPAPSPADQAELDDLLDKINAGGIDSLTSSEKRRLNELSKRLRDG